MNIYRGGTNFNNSIKWVNPGTDKDFY